MASTIKVDNVQNQPGTNIIDKCGTTITLGQSGDTIALACGASQTGFGRTGTVDWITTPKVTGDSPITGVTGKGYFLDTTSGTITINLPAGAAGSIISMADYARTWQTNNVTVTPNGSEKIGGINGDGTLSTEGQSVTFVYIDSTQGWINVQDSTSAVQGTVYIAATVSGACNAIVTSGDYKTAIFKGPGTFCVSAGAGSFATADYLVVAGGGGARSSPGAANAGGGGGGFRLSNSIAGGIPAPSTSPLAAATGLAITVQGYPIAVGGGGTNPPAVPGGTQAPAGSVSSFDTIPSAGGGGAGSTGVGGAGGSGGGGSQAPAFPGPGYAGGAGNTPYLSPPQGNPGGAGWDGLVVSNNSGGGGGAGVAGTDASNLVGGAGGAGSYIACAMVGPTAPSYGTPGPTPGRYFAGGGGGSTDTSGTDGAGGAGGGGAAGNPGAGCNGTVNTGGGSGGGGPAGGGSGIVMIRYKFQ